MRCHLLPAPRTGCQNTYSKNRSSTSIPNSVMIARNSSAAMVLHLIRNVGDDLANVGRADREGPVPVLPLESGEPLLGPNRRCLLHLSNEVGNGVVSPQSRQEVDVVSDAANAGRDCSEPADGATDIGVKIVTPRISDHRSAALGREDDVDVERQMGGCHVRFWHPFRVRGKGCHANPGSTGVDTGAKVCDPSRGQEQPELPRITVFVPRRIRWVIPLAPLKVQRI